MKRIYLIVLMVWIVASCGSSENDVVGNGSTSIDEFGKNINTVKAVVETQVKEMTFAGKVISNPDKTVCYSPLVNGVIERTYFSVGEKVSKGSRMLDIRSAELSALQSELVALESSLSVAKRELVSAEAMYADRMLSEKEYIEVKGRLKQLQAAYDKAQSDMLMYGSNIGGGVFSIVSPMSGYVISKKGTSGGTVFSDGEPLFCIADLSEVWVIVNVYASNLQFISEGMEAEVSSIAYPNKVFKGKIDHVSQVFDSEDKALKARLVLSNNEMKLKPEMSVVIRVRNQNPADVISLPSEAVIFDDDAYFVVIKNGDEFSIREIVLSGNYGNSAYLSSGVDLGEEVVTKGQLLIYNELKGK